MPVYIKDTTQLFHIHIPKTGGTAITDDFKKLGWRIEHFSKQPQKDCGNVTAQHMSRLSYEKNINWKSMPSFMIIRDPWARTVSEYVWRERTDDFSKLNKWLYEILCEIKQGNSDHCYWDNHFLPQIYYHNDTSRIFSYDQFDKVLDWLRSYEPNLTFSTTPQKRLEYKKPSIDIISEETQQLWHLFYKQDIELYIRLIN